MFMLGSCLVADFWNICSHVCDCTNFILCNICWPNVVVQQEGAQWDFADAAHVHIIWSSIVFSIIEYCRAQGLVGWTGGFISWPVFYECASTLLKISAVWFVWDPQLSSSWSVLAVSCHRPRLVLQFMIVSGKLSVDDEQCHICFEVYMLRAGHPWSSVTRNRLSSARNVARDNFAKCFIAHQVGPLSKCRCRKVRVCVHWRTFKP